MKHDFENFLNRHLSYEEYFKALKDCQAFDTGIDDKSLYELLTKAYPEMLIIGAFTWTKTNKGHEQWSRLNALWLEENNMVLKKELPGKLLIQKNINECYNPQKT